MSKWTHFWDMHSGGGTKEEPYEHIYIEAPEKEAIVIFYNRFGHNPNRVTCTCCGSDYSISEGNDLRTLTAFHRNCRCLANPKEENGLYKDMSNDPVFQDHYYLEKDEDPPEGYKVDERWVMGDCQTLDEYIASENVLVIRAEEIKIDERRGEVPEQGYIWVD